MSEHARLSPSDSPRWMTCAGAIALCEKLKVKRSGSIFSAEGTFAHTVRETCLELDLNPFHLLGLKGTVDGYDFELDEEMAEHLQPGIDRIRQFQGPMTVEKRMFLDKWMPDQFGTLDLGIAGKDLIVISDLKYGAGVPVEAVMNWQQIIYALGFYDNIARHITDAKRFLIIIDQPRHSAGGGEWEVSLDDLLAYGQDVKRAAAKTKDPNAPRCASSKACMWCPASKVDGACPEFEAFMLKIAQISLPDLEEAADLDLPPPLPTAERLSPEARSFIVQNGSFFMNWIDRMKDDLLERALRGEPVHGLKAVDGRLSPMKYIDKAKAEKIAREEIGSQAFKETMKTPTQIKKELGDETFAKISSVVTRGASKPQLVSLSDARPALTPSADKLPSLD